MKNEALLRENLKRGGYILAEFKGNRREMFGNPYEFPFKPGDYAIVEADRGEDAGLVRHALKWRSKDKNDLPVFMVIRRAGTKDHERLTSIKHQEIEALDICRHRIVSHNLPMKLVDAECRFDGLKLTFFFTADGRVDFRELVRDLAGAFRTRIELRQIGSRDEAKRCESYGLCGCRICCANFLEGFQPITTHMAKKQNLILNPSKLSGLCGRLKCCLAYEIDSYSGGRSSEAAASIRRDGQEDGSDGGLDEISD